MDNKKNETFNYTYSAKQQEEIKAIRKKYAPPEENILTTLHRLDASVSKKAAVRALTAGIIGTLILGFGMSLTMSNLSEILGSDGNLAMAIGIATGLIGIALICSAYPIYNRTVKKERERIAPEVLRLTDELMK